METQPHKETSDLTTDQVANLYKQFSANALRIQRYRGESPFPTSS